MKDTITTEIPVIIDAPHRRFVAGGEPMIFHCHHYNTFLQQSIQDADYVDSKPFLVGAANEVAFGQLSALFRDEGIADIGQRKMMASAVYQWAGFGRVGFGTLTEQGGIVETMHSHYSHAWKIKFGGSKVPVDLFTSGWLTGALAAIYDVSQGHFSVRQSSGIATGAATNTFNLVANGDRNYALFNSPGVGPLTTHRVRPIPESPVDYEGIFGALTAMEIVGDATGAIPAFGVYLTRHYANYYNRISFEFIHAMKAMFGDEAIEIAQPLMVEAGHVCAFNTFGGIMTSPEWDALIKPQLKSKEDWGHGIVAAVNALGWGRWQVTEISEEEARFTIHDDYESVGHLAAYGKVDYPVSFLAQGAAKGIMNLVYLGDVQHKPEFSAEFYQQLFGSEGSYTSEVIESRARGDEATSFRVYRP